MRDTKESQSIEDKIIALLEGLSTADSEQDKDSDPVIRAVLAEMWSNRADYNKEKLEKGLNYILEKNGHSGQTESGILNSLNIRDEILRELDQPINATEICNHFIKNRKGRPFRSAATFVGSILFPLEFITKDVFLCFKALNDGLSFIVPALKIMSKYLPWVAGASFVLEGLCMLADDAQERNTDKSRKIEACLYLLGGAACIALAVLAPYSYVALLVTIWGISVGIYAARSMIALRGNYQAKNTLLAELSKLKTSFGAVESLSFKQVEEKIEESSLSESQKKYLQARVAKLRESKDGDGSEEDKERCTLGELEKILDPYQGFLQTIRNNSVVTNAYLVFSFACAVIGCYAPEAAFVPATVGYVVSTCAVVAGRISSYFSNSSIREAQENPFKTSEEVEQVYHLGDSENLELEEKVGLGESVPAGPEPTVLAEPEPAVLAGPEPAELARPDLDNADMMRRNELKELHDKIKEEIKKRAQRKQLVHGGSKINHDHPKVKELHRKVKSLINKNSEKSHSSNKKKLEEMLRISSTKRELDIQELHRVMDNSGGESDRFSERDAGLGPSSGPS